MGAYLASLLTVWDWAETAEAQRLIPTVPAKADAYAIFLVSIKPSSVTGTETNRSDRMNIEKSRPDPGYCPDTAESIEGLSRGVCDLDHTAVTGGCAGPSVWPQVV
jgi:hypothetical protein